MPPVDLDSSVHCRLDELLAERKLTLTELSKRVDVSIVNLSVLKNDRAKAIRFSTLTAICRALDCSIGDLLVLRPQT
ncbi:helix-turn-helix transcriptional regulator [Arthrobacter sp. zg-Y820]|uniref:helix-turn-helix domain-containing protein n=1 Tax=unclassified Arthrobacter TaxID=235627 RepID=UPI0025423A38|nr:MULTISPECIES: helix-turn-helix transcriptional regulator [unclassified Arthrobacter]MCC9196764.1 helix-turn-helix transcriptional regulator [Arthrobacter sp. zg-Y820]MDK1279626.1 helix-turn-helix transcriptional regulator [Arthrobacter sp. zg.Y820]WIB08003.1 helix-turn-helix transcriptional regulator [Arthrobacter sp. zg-Y820]